MEALGRRPFPGHPEGPLLTSVFIASLLRSLGLLREQLNEPDADFDGMELLV